MAATVAAPTGGVNNTAYLFFVLALAFLFYITVRGDLGKWLGLIGLAGSAPPAAQNATAQQATSNSNFLGAALPDVLSGSAPSLPALPFLGQAQ